MTNRIVRADRYLRPTVYGWVLTFTVFYSSGHSRKWWLRNNIAKLWLEDDFNINSSVLSKKQAHSLPCSVSAFINQCAENGTVYFVRHDDYAVTRWG